MAKQTYKKHLNKKGKPEGAPKTADVKVEAITYTDGITVNDLATKINKSSGEVIKILFMLGKMVTINSPLDQENVELVCMEYNIEATKVEPVDDESLLDIEEDDPKDLVERAPIVTIMGHVDHGKTSILDAIRSSNVVSGEFGGITQHIGAYQIIRNKNPITFIDTPGHEAFTEMRSRGASVTDIVVLIVAANDGVMPQTIEAIDHAKAAGVPIVVAVNKCDLPDARPERVLTELTEHGLIPESYGGDTVVCNISAKQGTGVPELLETLILIAEMKNLKANPNRYALGTVIEARNDKKIGSVVSLLVQSGTLRLGDPVVVGTCYGKVRSLKDDRGNNITMAKPSTPVEITGLNELPSSGDRFMAFETEKEARSVSDERKLRSQAEATNRTGMTLDDLFSMVKDGTKEISVVLKTDVKGSEEAVKHSLEKINIDGVTVNIIRSGVGNITESDVTLADASKAIIIGFNVRPDSSTQALAKEHNIEIPKSNAGLMLSGILSDTLLLVSPTTTEIDKETAGIMLSAIISDTLLFKSPTCTKQDVSMAKRLAKIAEVDIESYGMEMFKAGTSLKGKTVAEIFNADYKTFKYGAHSVGVGQVNSLDLVEFL